MVEKSFYNKIGKYYLKRCLEMKRSITWEPKFTRGKFISFSCLMAHQEEKLLESERAFSHKIPDVGRLKKPFDGITVYNAFPVVPIIFYEPRRTEIYEISIRAFIKERESSDRKSLTKGRASEIGTRIYL